MAPLCTALFALVTEATGHRLGDVLPALYGARDVGFTDVTTGDNGAYRAAAGWDATTGLGVPSGRALCAALRSSLVVRRAPSAPRAEGVATGPANGDTRVSSTESSLLEPTVRAPALPSSGGPAVRAADVPPTSCARLALAPVTVAEVTAEREVDDPPEIPWHITPPVGEIALQLRTTVHRVAIGAGLARNAELVEAVRNLPGVPAVVTSPAGGTFIVGGEAWLGLCAIGSPPPGQPMPLDWMLHSLHRWFERRSRAIRCGAAAVERVEGAWCPGFSDIAVRRAASWPGSVSGSPASESSCAG